MGGPHVFGFTGALRKTKAKPVLPIPQTETETRIRSAGNNIAYQRKDSTHTLTGTREFQEEYSHVDSVKDLTLGSRSACEMATEGGTLVAAGHEELGQVLHAVHKKASSQVLGNHNYESSCNSESRVDRTGQSLRGYESSSTLRSFYDPQKTPLAVSQQTSNSSARDFALRKGCPPVVSIEKPVSRVSHCKEIVDSATLKSAKKASPIRFDLSMLFPKPTARHEHLVSSRMGGGPTNEVPDRSSMPPAVPLGPSTSQMHRLNIANTNKASHRLQGTEEPSSGLEILGDLTISTRNPTGGVKHWFDNFEEEDLEIINHYETVGFRPSTKSSRDMRSPINKTPAELEAKHLHLSNSSLHNKAYEPKAGKNLSYLQMPSATDPRIVSPTRELRLALQNWEFRSKHHRTHPAKNGVAHSRKDRSNPFNKVNLQKDSVLWLSSSDDESEADESLQSDIGTTIPGIRDSLIVGQSDSSDVEIGTAHAVQTKRPRLEKEFSRPTSQSHASRVKGTPLKTVEIPERQSSRIFSFLNDQSPSLPNTPEGFFATAPRAMTSSDLVGDYLHSSTTASQKQRGVSRLMTVTAQEELLLEAIRSKRASMRPNVIAETARRTSQRDQVGRSISPQRPRTAGLEAEFAAFPRLDQDSVPTLSAFHNHRRSLSVSEALEFNGMEPRDSCSTDPLTSHRGSLAFSSLPSSSSQESPPTPPLESPPDTSARRTNSSTKRYSTLPTKYQRHSRVRTGSSAVIVLDNLDDDSSIKFKQDALPIWAFNGWTERPGIAAVH